MLVSNPEARCWRLKFRKTNIDTSFDNDKHSSLYLLWNRFLDLIGRFPLGLIISSGQDFSQETH